MYKLNRYEKYKNHEGEVTGIFIAIGNEVTSKEHWLTVEEMESVLKDETNLTPILETVASEMELAYQKSEATKPQPLEIATSEQKDAFVISESKVDKKLKALKEEKKEKIEK